VHQVGSIYKTVKSGFKLISDAPFRDQTKLNSHILKEFAIPSVIRQLYCDM